MRAPFSPHPCITLLNVCQSEEDKQIICSVTMPEVYYSLYTYSVPAAQSGWPSEIWKWLTELMVLVLFRQE